MLLTTSTCSLGSPPPAVLTVLVLAFCSWSMCRMRMTSNAFSRTGCTCHDGPNISLRLPRSSYDVAAQCLLTLLSMQFSHVQHQL